MTDSNSWETLSDEDKIFISNFVSSNNSIVREMMRNKFPSLYIGRTPGEVAKGWLMIAGIDEVKNYIGSFKK